MARPVRTKKWCRERKLRNTKIHMKGEKLWYRKPYRYNVESYELAKLDKKGAYKGVRIGRFIYSIPYMREIYKSLLEEGFKKMGGIINNPNEQGSLNHNWQVEFAKKWGLDWNE